MSREKHAPRPVGFWAAVAVFILLLADRKSMLHMEQRADTGGI